MNDKSFGALEKEFFNTEQEKYRHPGIRENVKRPFKIQRNKRVEIKLKTLR